MERFVSPAGRKASGEAVSIKGEELYYVTKKTFCNLIKTNFTNIQG